ncbi:hypothetical protein [Flavobacterium aquicola]|uniref:Lipoprotein n=1 Tax=Flavobacterium aquicola TaxID=1682742 RepID=A0A3E0DXL0_9FLAO|nr:hypothetical protein [Flavobacterium aquicola]REG90837.1 hypothetical protein C8P67_11849 [Flavobacterium aquicola]
MKNRSFLLSALVITLFSFVSCTKEDSLAATDNSPIVASVSIDLVNELDVKMGTEISFEKLTAKQIGKTTTCAVITTESGSNFPKIYTVDFGDGCTTNGITRKGKLKITFSNIITETGSTMLIERENYYVNGNKVEGKIEYKNTTVSSNTPQWTRTVTNGIFTDSKGEVYFNSGTHTVKQTAGVSTPLVLQDNTYEMIDGNHTVSKQNGGQITLTILETLVKNYSCDYVSKGKIKVESTLLSGTIDYGNGDCDKDATYTQNGIIFPFTM